MRISQSLVFHSLYSYQDITVFGQYKLLRGGKKVKLFVLN
jgi:hypothetical protein